MKRILTWHFPIGSFRDGQAYYIENATPLSVRIHADSAPSNDDAKFEIKFEGVNVTSNRAPIVYDTYGRVTSQQTITSVVLSKGQNSEESAEDFIIQDLENGWLTCSLSQDSAGKNFTVQMDLMDNLEDEESSEDE